MSARKRVFRSFNVVTNSSVSHTHADTRQGDISIDGEKVEKSLIRMVQDTQQHSNDNNVIKFEDNSSAIRGFSDLSSLIPSNPSEASLMCMNQHLDRHIIFTAETHNFPTGVAPFQGATTGSSSSAGVHVSHSVVTRSCLGHD